MENKAFVLWLTGLSGAGKSTLADRVYDHLAKDNPRVERLDGDLMRGIFPTTGFSKAERDEHIEKVGFLASMLQKHGVTVVASFISPYKEARRVVRGLCGNFVEVYVKASVEQCRKRDVKGLYKKALAGEIKNFTGIDDPYEEPENPEIIIDTDNQTVDESVATILEYIKKNF